MFSVRFRQIKARLYWWWQVQRPGWFKNHFFKREYIVLTHDGISCIMEPIDACETLQDADEPTDYKLKSIWITPHQFSKIPEFLGF